jgi:hypothetical protein
MTSENQLRTCVDVNQKWGADNPARGSDNLAILWPDNPPVQVSNGYILGGAINTPPLLPPQAARAMQEEHPFWSHQIRKITSLNPPKLLIFGESKEKALIK